MNEPPIFLSFALALSAACSSALGADQAGARRTDSEEVGSAAALAREVDVRPEITPTWVRAPGARSLKVATWNLEWLDAKSGAGPVKRGADDYARLRAYADRLGADVIALQEVNGAAAAARVFDPRVYALHVSEQREPQRTGFAFRRGLRVTVHADYSALDVGQVRAGADLSVELDGRIVRMLSVHLKSGCFDAPLSSARRDCTKLAAQLPALEAWIDARAREGVAALVLGDFNRRLFGKPEEPFWRELDDGDPPGSELWSPTQGQSSRCWGGEHAAFIDHLVFNRLATALFVRGSFEQLLYDTRDAAHRRTLSDHCPLAVTLSAARAGGAPSAAGATLPAPRGTAPATTASERAAAAPAQPGRKPREERTVKGNINAARRKLYHLPGCPEYAQTKIDPDKGERWFASAAEAEAAGWSKASNCP